MNVLRLLCMALPIAAQEPRQLAFSFGKVQMSGNGVSNSPLGQMNNVWNQAGSNMVQPGQQPQHSGNQDPFNSGPAPFSDDPFGGIASTPAQQPQGLAVTPDNGAVILKSMIRSFLQDQQLQPGEEQCLEQGCSALGGQASAVAQNIVMIGESIMTVKQIGKETSGDSSAPANPQEDMDAMMDKLSHLMDNKGGGGVSSNPLLPQAQPTSAPAASMDDFFGGLFGKGTNPNAVPSSPPAPQNANTAMNMFGWAQGRRLQFAMQGLGAGMGMGGGMGGMGMGGGMGGAPVDPMVMMGGAAMAAQLAKQVKDLSDLTVKVSDKCLQGDARQTFALATQRAQDPGWLEKAAISQGPAELGAMADTITAYKKGNATGFGNRIGAAMRKVLLTNPDDIVTEKLPDEKTLPNVTGGFMKGFFGPGMSATITTPEEPNGIHIDLQKCVGNNVGLFQGVWASILKFYQNQGLPSTQAAQQQQASLMAYFAMQMPKVMKLCNLGPEDIQALKDAAMGMGKGVNFQLKVPQSDYSKTQAMSDMAQTVGGYANLVQHPSSSLEFGQNLGQVFQKALEGSMSQKYFVDSHGNLRLRLRQLSSGRAGAQSMMIPALLVVVVLLLLLVLLAVKSRRALQGWKEHVCQMECSEVQMQNKAESLDVEASEIKPILDEVH